MVSVPAENTEPGQRLPRRCSRPRGLTLIEGLVALAVVAVLLAVAAPGFSTLMAHQRLKAATNALYSKLYAAKSEAIKRNTRIRVTFRAGAGGSVWCYGFRVDAACDCNVSGSCQIGGQEKVVRSTDHPGVGMSLHISHPGDRFIFDGGPWIMHGTFGHVRFVSPGGKQTRVIVSRLGRLRTCSPAGAAHVPGYSTAC